MKQQNHAVRLKDISVISAVTAAILSIPLIAMRLTDEVRWTLFDFVVMGILVSGTGFLIAFASRSISNRRYRTAAVIALVAGFLLVWIHLAVGIGNLPFGGS